MKNLPALTGARILGAIAILFASSALATVAIESAHPDQSPASVPGQRSFSEFKVLAEGPQQVRLLPGQSNAVFSLYGAPGDLDHLRQLVGVMKEQHLGNAFDPGPSPRPGTEPIFNYLASVGWPVLCYSGGDMQVVGGRGPFREADALVLASMDKAGVFTALQLGEWGYYFHNLSWSQGWWRDNFGPDYEAYKHLMKPAGLAGYDRRPGSKQECFETVKAYFQTKSGDLLNRVISVTGHSHYEAYAGEWGAKCIGLEVGENIAFTQSKLAFARGGSRQWQKPWSVQISPWMNGACTTSGPLRKEGNDARGLDAGHSLSFYERMWLHAWFAGAALVTPENNISTFFEKPEAPWTLTSHGRKGAEIFQFMQSHERGIPYAPVAIVLDHLAGYNGYMDKPWGILPPTQGDRKLRDLFDYQLFPQSDHIHTNVFPNNPELAYLRPTPFGEMFDVQLTSASLETLSSYPTLLLAGDIEFEEALRSKLEAFVSRGGRLLLSGEHQKKLAQAGITWLTKPGVEILADWTNPVTHRPAAIANERLKQLEQESLPIEISGDPIEYQLNRLPTGWVVELINNHGVTKFKDQPAVIDDSATAAVVLHPRIRFSKALEWRSHQSFPGTESVSLKVGPGQSVFVEFTK